jgi:putative ABC transport system substrate-binding protein
MLFVTASCANLDRSASNNVSDVQQADEHRVLVVNTNTQIERYRIAEESFLSLFNEEQIETLDLGNELEPLEFLQDKINTADYDAIYSIGAKSLALIDYIAPEVPVVYSSVINWRKFSSEPRYYGVASEISLVAQLTWFKYFFPDLKSLGVIYSKKNAAKISEAQRVAESLNINLVSRQVKVGEKLDAVSEDLSAQVQAIWLISDLAVIASEDRVNSLFELTKRKRLPVLTYNDIFIEMGALLSISADLPTMGRQAALTMREVLNNRSEIDSVIYPAGSSIILNQTALEESDLKINEDAMDSLNDIRY